MPAKSKDIRPSGEFRFSWLSRAWPDLAAFLLGLGLAWFLHWQTTDLVWSLWLSSLVVGYLTILSAIGGGVLSLFHRGVPAGERAGGLFLALFLLGFFTVHFCGFHTVHAAFLSSFFPLPGQSEHAAAGGPLEIWRMAFGTVVPRYGIFLAPVLLAERKQVLAGWTAIREGWGQSRPWHPSRRISTGPGGGGIRGDMLFRPYLNVVRMHLLIFFFAFCHFLKVESFFVYAVVYAVYFFPWSLAWKAKGPAARVLEGE